jgi:LmbE family N-acetylglucosaminyl deacetylase
MILLVCAHPDDETIGAATLLSRRAVTLLHVTDGAPADGQDAMRHGFATTADYAAARRREVLAALRLAGVPAERALAMGIPDQQAAFHIPAIARRVAALVAQLRPRAVLTHAYEGGHPDHDAVACAVHLALRRWPRRALWEMTGYHAGPDGIATGRFLPVPFHPPHALPFDEAARALKQRMRDCFVTQSGVLRWIPLGPDLLRRAPAHDFTRPPHDGALFYEGFGWGGLDGARFRALAAEAMACA